MDQDKALLAELYQQLVTRNDSTEWEALAPLLAGLERIGRNGSVALVKVDGIRPTPEVYTVVLSGGLLGESFFRENGDDLRTLLREAIRFYVREVCVAAPLS